MAIIKRKRIETLIIHQSLSLSLTVRRHKGDLFQVPEIFGSLPQSMGRGEKKGGKGRIISSADLLSTLVLTAESKK